MEQQWSVVEDLDLVMAMYNLIEYSSHYSETKMNFWFDSKDEAINFNDEIENKITSNLLTISLTYCDIHQPNERQVFQEMQRFLCY